MTLADSLRHLGLSAPDPRSDGELVGRFTQGRDEGAFAELFRRHGPTVLGVCRRVLGNAPDADDAFQAVFLVLARKAVTIRPPGMVGNWLYGVAVRTANKARVMNAKRQARESTPHPPGAVDRTAPGGCGVLSADTLAVIDAELAALPEQYRAAFVACELNGRSRSEAARDLGWPEGTVAARLAKARELLAARLSKRGVTLAVGAFAGAAVPAATAAETLTTVREFLAVGTATAVAPAAQQLSDEVVKTMNLFNVKWLLLGGLVLTLATGGTVLVAGSNDRPVREQIKAPVPKEAAVEWKEGNTIELDGKRVTGVAYSPDGTKIAIAQDAGLTVCDAKTRKPGKPAPLGEQPTVRGVAFSPAGDYIAVTSKNGVVFASADTEPKQSGTWTEKGSDPGRVLVLHDGIRVVATDGTKVIANFGHNSGLNAATFTVKGWAKNSRLPSPLASFGEHYLLCACDAGGEGDAQTVFCVSTEKASVVKDEVIKLTGHKGRPVAAAWSKEGDRIVTADEGGTLIVWDAETFKEKSRLELGAGVVQLALAPDGKTVAAVRAYSDTTLLGRSGRTLFNLELFVFDVTAPPKEPKPLWSAKNLLSDAKQFTGPASLAFSPDGKTLLAAFADPYYDSPKAAEEEGRVDKKPAKSMGVKVWELVPKK